MGLNTYVQRDMQLFLQLAKEFPGRADAEADERLCRYAAHVMKEKLDASRVKGRGGWWDENQCSTDHLRASLRQHVAKGDMVDVMNLAAMVYARECVE